MPVRVGVIGVGYLGRHHARIYSGLEDAELVAVADMDKGRAEEIAKTYSCGFFSGYEDIIEACDALSIVSPTTTHHEIALACIRAGKDIFIEKPIAAGVDEAREITREAGRKGILLQVGHIERYNQAVVAATSMIGDPRFLEAERLSPFLGRATDVDVTIDLMIHDVDIILSIVRSKVKEIRAMGESFLTDRIDVAKAWIEFENGCKAVIAASRLASEKKRTLKVFQRDSFISLDYQTQEVTRCTRKGADISSDVIRPENREPLKEELKDFIRCVRTRSTPAVSGAEATDALEIALRVTEIISGGGR